MDSRKYVFALGLVVLLSGTMITGAEIVAKSRGHSQWTKAVDLELAGELGPSRALAADIPFQLKSCYSLSG